MGRSAGGDALDHRCVDVDIVLCSAAAVGLEEPCGQENPGALVPVGERMVPNE